MHLRFLVLDNSREAARKRLRLGSRHQRQRIFWLGTPFFHHPQTTAENTLFWLSDAPGSLAPNTSVDTHSMMSPPFKLKPCIATMSLGSSDLHDLTHKIRVAACEGFRGIELYWDDLVYDCRKDLWGDKAPEDVTNQAPKRDDLIRSARRISKVCYQAGVEVVSLQPFRDFDGTRDGPDKDQKLKEFEELWLPCARVLGAGMIAVPATINGAGKSGLPQDIVRDICSLAERAREYSISIAYEGLCFSAFVDTWQGSLRMVNRAERAAPHLANVGIILDTFNIAGKLIPYGCKGGIEEVVRSHEAVYSSPGKLSVPKKALAELGSRVPRSKVLLVQVADLDFETAPSCGHAEVSKDCIRSYSRNQRLFPFESRNKSIQKDLLRAVVGRRGGEKKGDDNGQLSIGYAGWVSIEVFNKSTQAGGEGTVVEHAKRAWKSWLKMCEEMGWNGAEE